MLGKKNSYVLAASIATALAALLITGTGLTSQAQVTGGSSQDLSGTVNSLVQQNGEATYIIGGQWDLSIDDGSVSDFSADLAMAKTDGTGAHTHRIVMFDNQETIELASEQNGPVQVTLTPTEQTVGGTVLVNATGLGRETETVVKVGDLVAGNPESDANGNVLFALGTSDNMTGSLTVTVEDELNSGSASLTIVESENATNVQPGNLTTTENAGNLTSSQPGNVTGTQPSANQTTTQSGNVTQTLPSTNQTSTNQTTYGTTIEGQSLTTTSAEVDNTTDINPDGNLTTFEETAIQARYQFEDMNATSGTSNATSGATNATSTTNGNTTSFTFLADIYSNDELKWEGVSVTVTMMNDQVITMEIDPAATDNHFAGQPIFGMANTIS